MKVILLQDVAKIGRRFSVVDVPDGYALNKLIPQRLAEPATPANIKRVEARNQKMAASEANTAREFHEAVAALKDKTVELVADASAEGKLFQALKPQMIVDAVLEQTKIKLEEAWVHTATPVKTTGSHTVLLAEREEQGEFTINVVAK